MSVDPVRVLLVHNRYRTSAPSGEDQAVANERRMLEAHGVEVSTFDRCNDDIDESSWAEKGALAVNTIWSRRSRLELQARLRSVRPDIVHVHNTFAMISPSIYGACRAEGVPVVQTLHNFRFFCPGGLFLRDGKPCEDCVDHSLLESVRHRCYRNSVGATAAVASMLALHRTIGTYTRDIDLYITPTKFGRSKAIKAGIPESKVVVKPNFVPDPPRPGPGAGGYVTYVGRLTEGKGSETLVAAWRRLPSVRLKIVGDGAFRSGLEAIAKREALNIEFVGMQPKNVVLDAMANAEFLVMPSECYEAFGMVIAESFACGTPVLASNIGSMGELVEDGVTGRKFTAGDPASLAHGVEAMLADKARLRDMRANARSYFDAHLTEDQNSSQLLQIYQDVLASAGR